VYVTDKEGGSGTENLCGLSPPNANARGNLLFSTILRGRGKGGKELGREAAKLPMPTNKQTNKHARNERLSPPSSQLVQCVLSLQKRARKRNSLAAINDVCFLSYFGNSVSSLLLLIP